MTADEIRAIEAEVEAALGWTLVEPGYETPEHSIAPLWRHTDGRERVGGPRRYITDPAATAEVRDWIDAQLWGWVSANRGGKYSDIVVFEIYSPEGKHLAEAFEERSKHGGKASQAEAAAMCRCLLQACRATGATATTETVATIAVLQGE